jgi:REP element-mobilizing transposase RayT
MAQSLSKILVHLIFSTKKRERLIQDNIREELHSYLGGVLKELESPAVIINSVEDHVHVLFSASKNHSLSKIVEKVKTASSNGLRVGRAITLIFTGKMDMAHFRSANPMRTKCGVTLKTKANIIGAKLSRKSFENF